VRNNPKDVIKLDKTGMHTKPVTRWQPWSPKGWGKADVLDVQPVGKVFDALQVGCLASSHPAVATHAADDVGDL